METLIVTDLLQLMIELLGILTGFLLIFLQFVPERKRKINDILITKHVDILIEDIKQNKDKEKNIEEDEIITLLQKTFDKKDITVKFLNYHISLIKINLFLFIYTIILLISCIAYYAILKNFSGATINGILVCILLVLTSFNYLLLILVAHLSCTKNYRIKKSS